MANVFEELTAGAAQALDAEGVPRGEQVPSFQMDLRYRGQGLLLTLDVEPGELAEGGLEGVGRRFDELHRQLFTFALDADKEFVNLRAVAESRPSSFFAPSIAEGGADAAEAVLRPQSLFCENREHEALIYDRAKLRAGNRIPGPAIVLEMDSTTLILPGHKGEIDAFGNILINPA